MTILYVEQSDDDVLFFARSMKEIAPGVAWQFVVDIQEAKCYLKGQGIYEERNRYPFPTLVIATSKLRDGKAVELLRWAHARPELSLMPFCVFDGMPEHLREPLPDPTLHRYFEKPARLREWPVILQQILTWSETSRETPLATGRLIAR